MRADAPAIGEVIWCPSKEGHLRYSHQLADAIAALRASHTRQEPATAVLTTCPIGTLYRETAYPMQCVGRQIRDRASFPTRLHWALDRIGYRLGLERRLLAWVAAHPECHTVHLQESHLLTAPFTAARLRRMNRRIVYTMHNVAPHVRRGALASWIQQQLTRAFLRRADALIVHADSLRDALATRFRLDPARIHVVPHGVWTVDAASTPPAPAPATSATSAISASSAASASMPPNQSPGHEPPPNGPRARLLFYGTLRENKGLHHLLDAFASAPAHWHLTIAGKIDEPAWFDARIAPRISRLQAAGRLLEFRPGYLPEAKVPALFGAADLLVLPYDGFLAQSGVLFDAIAWRTPVVVTPSGALGDTVRASGIGVVSDSCAPADLLAAIGRGLAIDPVSLADAWQRVRVQNAWSTAAERTLAVYRMRVR